MKKKLTIKSYFPIARAGDEIHFVDKSVLTKKYSNEKVIKITDDYIYTNNRSIQCDEYEQIKILSQAKPDWDNLKVEDVIIFEGDSEEYDVSAVLNNVVFYDGIDGSSFSGTKRELKRMGVTIKDTREDKEEASKAKRILKTIKDCGCACHDSNTGICGHDSLCCKYPNAKIKEFEQAIKDIKEDK